MPYFLAAPSTRSSSSAHSSTLPRQRYIALRSRSTMTTLHLSRASSKVRPDPHACNQAHSFCTSARRDEVQQPRAETSPWHVQQTACVALEVRHLRCRAAQKLTRRQAYVAVQATASRTKSPSTRSLLACASAPLEAIAQSLAGTPPAHGADDAQLALPLIPLVGGSKADALALLSQVSRDVSADRHAVQTALATRIRSRLAGQ
jgi:hypothetical protein